MTAAIRAIDTSSDALVALVAAAMHEQSALRGGTRLLEAVAGHVGASDASGITEHLVDSGSLFGVLSDDGSGFAALTPVDHRAIMGIYVPATHRRRGLGLQLLTYVLRRSDPPVDAWVLPGDRATKSLYERAGWKARMLTMSGE